MSPRELIKTYIVAYVEDNNLDKHLIEEIPKKWEKYGDFVIFDERTFVSSVWKSLGSLFWEKLAVLLMCKRIALKNKINNDDYRTPNVTILLGNDPWILHKDNSIKYTWNIEKNMFSAGNVSERHRIAKFVCLNETVVDLFAGIGYFTLPFLVHTKAKFVHACEWNPVAVEALKRNLHLNKVQYKCKIYDGDNRVLCPKKVANRINVGLIPSSEKYWEIACEALVTEGGILHIHENVETKVFCIKCCICTSIINSFPFDVSNKNVFMSSKQSIIQFGKKEINWKHHQWLFKGVHILHSLLKILTGIDSTKIWDCSIDGVNFVKSYAPHVHHLVYDVVVKNISPL